MTEHYLNTALWAATCAAWDAMQSAELDGVERAEALTSAFNAAERKALPELSMIIDDATLLAAYSRAVAHEAVVMVHTRGKPPMLGSC